MRPATIAIVDASQLFREGLQQLLRKPRFVIVAAVRTIAEVFGNAAAAKPDIVVIGSGAEIGSEIHAVCMRKQDAVKPRMRVVLLADVADTTELLLLRLALTLGVDAILSKDISGEVLQRSLELVMLGQQLFPAQLFPASLAECPVETPALPESEAIFLRPADAAPALIELEQREPAPPRPNLASVEQQCSVMLSERESQILYLLTNGATNKAIARELRVTEATVKVHVKSLLRKIHANNRTQAAIWALNSNFAVAQQGLEPSHANGHLR